MMDRQRRFPVSASDERLDGVTFELNACCTDEEPVYRLSGVLDGLRNFVLQAPAEAPSAKARDAVLNAAARALVEIPQRREFDRPDIAPERLKDGLHAAFFLLAAWCEPSPTRRDALVGGRTYAWSLHARILQNLCHNACLTEDLARLGAGAAPRLAADAGDSR